MSTEPHVVSLAPSSMGAVPRAVWIGGGLLALVTAALAGALIMRSVDPAPTSLPVTAAASVGGVAAQPVPPAASAAPAQAATALAPTTKPVHHANPATSQGNPGQAQWNAPGGRTQTALCASCGIVESVTAVKQKGEGTGLGAVAGGVLGGVVGHQVGGGKGKTAMTVLGAIGGGLAGNEVEKRARSETLYDVQVRMEDGSVRTFQRPQSMVVGTHVVVEGTTLRVARDTGSSNNNDAPRTLRTSAPAAGST